MRSIRSQAWRAASRLHAWALIAVVAGLVAVSLGGALRKQINSPRLLKAFNMSQASDNSTVTVAVGARAYAKTSCAADNGLVYREDGSVFGGGVAAAYLVVCIYVFLVIAVVCDHYFEPSLEAISDALSLTPDVARGAGAVVAQAVVGGGPARCL